MNKDEIQYKLEKEGIYGLTLKSRPEQEFLIDKQTGKRIPVLVDIASDEKTRKNDLRTYTAMGGIKPIQDYWIEGEGRTPLGIREVQTSIPGMKKYALLEEVRPQENNSKKRGNDKTNRIRGLEDATQYNVRVVYSEGIDFKLMAEDEEYAKQVIKLFQEERLQRRQELSDQLGLNEVYLGTIVKTENSCIIAGIKNYAEVVTDIAFKIKELQQAAEKEMKTKRQAEELAGMKRKIKEFIDSLPAEGRKELLTQLFEILGVEGMYNMLKDVVTEREHQNGNAGKGEQPVPNDDGQWEL